MGITFPRDVVSGLSMQVFVDTDYASKTMDRRSVSGGLVMCGGGRLSRFSRMQKCVTLSTTEGADYEAMADVLKEVLFLRQVWRFMLTEVGKYARIMRKRLSLHVTRNISTQRHNFIRDLVARKEISITHVASEYQRADLLTNLLVRSHLSLTAIL